MIGALALFATLVAQDTGTGLSPRVRAMLDEFHPPRNGEVALDTRFNVPEAYVGEQVELVTAAWFPRDLRERLRRQPTLRAPTLSGLWSASGTGTPSLVDTRRIDGRLYDLFIAHQILFPLGPGAIEAPSAVLTYAVPSSVSFFAPEDRKSLASRPVSIRILPIPASLTGRLGNGPTARGLRMSWRVGNQAIAAGTPVDVELVVSGTGNVTLWPTPDVSWPVGGRVYGEPTRETVRRAAGMIGGEKRFRFTLVPDSAGVVTLPEVRYPYFDPDVVDVRVATAPALPLVVQPRTARPTRSELPLVAAQRVPLATVIVNRTAPLLWLLAAAPLLLLAWRGRTRRSPPVMAAPLDPVEQLRRVAGRGLMRDPMELERVLRHKGVTAADARAVREWLTARSRHRWARQSPAPADEPALSRVLALLSRRGPEMLLLAVLLLPAPRLGAQADTAAMRYRAGDAAGAARLFAEAAARTPDRPDAWFNLGLARQGAGDPVGAAAAWLRGLELAPRDGSLRQAFHATPQMPTAVRRLAPLLPVSRDEFILIGLVAWLLAAWAWARQRRRLAGGAAVVMALAVVAVVVRVRTYSDLRVLVRAAIPLTVSPTPTAPTVATAPVWSLARIVTRRGDWVLIQLDAGDERGWTPVDRVAPLAALD